MIAASAGRARARSSERWAVAAAVSVPTLTPSMKRAVMRPGTELHRMNTTDAPAEIRTATMAIRRLPAQSLMWPIKKRLNTTPTANAEKMSVTTGTGKSSAAW